MSDEDEHRTEDILEIISNSVGKTLLDLDFKSLSNSVLQNWNALVESGMLTKVRMSVPNLTPEMFRALFGMKSLIDLPYFSTILPFEQIIGMKLDKFSEKAEQMFYSVGGAWGACTRNPEQ